jgi:hypothetical protein
MGGGVVEASGQNYMAWNDALAARFFNPESADQPVYLYVNEEIINEVGRPLGGDFDGFKAALRAGPPGMSRAGHCQRALQVAAGWRKRGLPYPPYVAYLGLFVLAGGREGDYGPRSYYPRLWDLLGEAEVGTPASFDRMLDLWDDLERWSVRDREGELGLFEARIVGGKIHIGLPLAQTVLTESERQALPRIFSNARFDPGSLPSDRELKRALVVQGRQWLRRQTTSVLERGTDGYLSALLEIVSEEFLGWDGTVAGNPDENFHAGMVNAGLRICLSIDRIAGRASITVRCRSTRELPPDGLFLTAGSADEPVTCTSFLPGWSQPLRDETGSVPLVPSHIQWRRGLELTDKELAWTLRLRPAQVRVFHSGTAEQLPGLVEEHAIPQNASFYLAYKDATRETMDPWLEQDCEGWQRIGLTSGIPPGWTFGSVHRARSDDGPRSLEGGLRFPDRCTLRLTGGIRAGAGNTFFSFAPPQVVLTGAAPGDTVVCNGAALTENARIPGHYELPSGLPRDIRIGVEVCRGDDVLKRRSIYLVSGSGWRLDEPLVVLDAFGSPTDAAIGIAGATAPLTEGREFLNDPLRTPGLHRGEHRTYFIGRSPGQIADWPTEPLPAWAPIWAVPFGRRGRALFCGNSLDDVAPLPKGEGSALQQESWRHILWQRRGRIATPKEPSLRALWRQYQEAARG